jgi:hypothetical protein
METVREFYKALYEKRFREALALSIYKPAIEGLTQQEFDELRPDFEAMAKEVEKVQLTGEQISGETATVFAKVPDDNDVLQILKIDLVRSNGAWIVGNTADESTVRKAGKDFFYNVRIAVHEDEASDMLQRIFKAQFVYSTQYKGLYADIPTLVKEGLLPSDIETPASTGYRYHIKLGNDKQTYASGAEPAQYGRTGRLSFYLDQTGVLQKEDLAGKPLIPQKKPSTSKTKPPTSKTKPPATKDKPPTPEDK